MKSTASSLLRNTLRADAAVCAVAGIDLVAFSGIAADLLGLQPGPTLRSWESASSPTPRIWWWRRAASRSRSPNMGVRDGGSAVDRRQRRPDRVRAAQLDRQLDRGRGRRGHARVRRAQDARHPPYTPVPAPTGAPSQSRVGLVIRAFISYRIREADLLPDRRRGGGKPRPYHRCRKPVRDFFSHEGLRRPRVGELLQDPPAALPSRPLVRVGRRRHPRARDPHAGVPEPRTPTAGSRCSSSTTARSWPNRTRSCGTSPAAPTSCRPARSIKPKALEWLFLSSTATSRTSPPRGSGSTT